MTQPQPQPQPTPSSPRRAGSWLPYAAGALVGLGVVTLPASATVLQGDFGVDAADYGGLFLFQTVAAIAGALAAGRFAAGSRACAPRQTALLCAAMTAIAIAHAALVLAAVIDAKLAARIAATALGVGFGVAAVPLNAVPAAVAPAARARATVAMHASVGGGFALGPGLVALALAVDAWSSLPLLLGAVTLAIGGAVLKFGLQIQADTPTRQTAPPAPTSVLGLVAIAIGYALAEGTFANWATVFLHDARSVDPSVAAIALSGFWTALAAGRLGVAVVLRRVSTHRAWQTLLVGMVIVMLALPAVAGGASGVLAFVLAGLVTSAVFPLTLSLAGACLGIDATRVAAIATAALMTGVGVGSWLIGAAHEALGFDALYRVSALWPATALVLGTRLFARERKKDWTCSPTMS